MAIIFAAMTYRVLGMVSGRPQEGVPAGELGALRLIPMLVLAAAILMLGVLLPSALGDALGSVAELFEVII